MDVRSRNSIPIHYGTFIGSSSETLEALIDLDEACKVHNVPLDEAGDENGRILVCDIGETIAIEVEEILTLL